MKHIPVSDWMAKPVVTIDPKATLPEARDLMQAKGIRRLPVVEEGRLVGIVTDGDLRGASPSGATDLSIHELNYLLEKLPVEKIMSTNPYTVSPYAGLTEAAKLMLEHKISALPVMDSDQLVGIITESDIFRAFVDLVAEGPEVLAAPA